MSRGHLGRGEDFSGRVGLATFPKDQVRQRLGSLPDVHMRKVNDALKAVLDVP